MVSQKTKTQSKARKNNEAESHGVESRADWLYSCVKSLKFVIML